jgi:hypothetical protein
MKKLLLVLLISYSTASGQGLLVGISGGTNTKLSPFAEGFIGYEFTPNIGIIYNQILLVLPSGPAYFGAAATYRANDYFRAKVGMMYRLQTTDRYTIEGSSNYWCMNIGATARVGAIDINVGYLNKSIFIGIGTSL